LAGMRADSLEAVGDSTKYLVGILGDSLGIATRRVVQLEHVNDSLGKKVGQDITARARIAIQPKPMTVTDTVEVVVQNDSTRIVSFDIYEKPVSLQAEIHVQPDTAFGQFSVQLDPIDLEIDLSCGQEVNGFRQANIFAISDKYSTIDIKEVQQSSEICNPKKVIEDRSTWQKVNELPTWLKVTVGGVVGYLIVKH
jgi:hypothetical protein